MSSVNKIALEWRDNIILSKRPLRLEETRTSHKNITCIRNVSPLPQQLEQIPKLTVNVSTDGDRARYGLYVRFLHENIPDFVAK